MAFPRKSEFQLERMIRSQRNPQPNRGRSSVALAEQPWREVVDGNVVRSRLIHKDLDPGNGKFSQIYTQT